MGRMMTLHAGGIEATFEQVESVPLPEETSSYVPLPHVDVLSSVQRIAGDLLSSKDMVFDGSQYALAKNGERLFFWMRWKDPGNDEMGYCIAGRNSYDKSMSFGLAFGANVFVCDNLALTGEVTVFRRHTKRVRQDIRHLVVGAIYGSLSHFDDVVQDAANMKRIPLTLDTGYRHLGLLYGKYDIKDVVLEGAIEEWRTAALEKHLGADTPTLWTLYNCCTHAAKRVPVQWSLEEYVKLHSSFRALAVER